MLPQNLSRLETCSTRFKIRSAPTKTQVSIGVLPMSVAAFAFFFRAGRFVFSESALILLLIVAVGAGLFALKIRGTLRREAEQALARKRRRDETSGR